MRCVTINQLQKIEQSKIKDDEDDDDDDDDDEYKHDFGTLVQTDVEVDLDVSDEYLANQAKEKEKEEMKKMKVVEGKGGEKEDTTSSNNNSKMYSSKGRTLGDSTTTATSGIVTGSSSISTSSSSRIEQKLEHENIEIPEPPPSTDASQVVRCKVKGRDTSGTPFVLSRSFMKNNPFHALFNWVRSSNSNELSSSSLLLRTQYPVREFAEADVTIQGKTFEELGISRQELFHLEV